jgi:hypothetical protein
LVLGDLDTGHVPLRCRSPGETSGLGVVGELVGVYEVNPKDQVLMEVPDYVNGVSDGLLSDL